ncbi:MAG: HEAT repeat domain-containing protein [Chloroflexaceae bacterium]|nr:HEAT repeat domain-containing protein [Chloroflexaceae bacterium]
MTEQGGAVEGRALTVETAIANLEQTEDLGLRYYAAWWLGKFRVQDEAAVRALVAALSDEADRSPDGGYPLRRNAARALGKLGNLRAIEPLIAALGCSDHYVREAAAQALELLGDRRSIEPLHQLLAGGVTAAVSVPGKPHLVQPYEAIIEALGTLGATEAISEIEPFLEHPVARVQLAAARALYQLTENPLYGDRLVQGLQADKIPLRRSALLDLSQSGYVAAAEPIANTQAENSMKLIALKGLLEYQLAKEGALSNESRKIMELMDKLL